MAIAAMSTLGARGFSSQDPQPAQIIVRRAEVERDLELVARVVEATPVHSWWPVSFVVEVVNRSPTTTYPIVRPGDGSDADWREPYVCFTTEVQAEDGTWQEVPHQGVARCGVYDPYWLDEVQRLAPGQSVRLDMGTTPFLPEHGALRIRAHYAYKARPPGRQWGDPDRSPPPGGLGGMQGVDPFELVSAPIEFAITAPEHTRAEIEDDLVLELGAANAKPSYSWTPVRLHARLRNRSTIHAHRVVRPGFFRAEERQEPHVAALAHIDRGDSRWLQADRLAGGFYDGPIDGLQARPGQTDWRSQVVELRPGQSIEFDLPASCALYDFREARAVRVSVDYGYSAWPIRDAKGECAAAPESLGAMAAVPPFVLHSNELTWPMSSPLEIEITPRGDRDATRVSSLADLVTVVLRNRGDEAIEISNAESAAKIEISVSSLMCGESAVECQGCLVVGPLVIQPNSVISLLEDPAIDPATMPRVLRLPGPARGQARAEALLHRPGWLHAFGDTWRTARR